MEGSYSVALGVDVIGLEGHAQDVASEPAWGEGVDSKVLEQVAFVHYGVEH